MVHTHPQSNADKVFGAKLALSWKGPFEIKEILTPVNLKVASTNPPHKSLVVHVETTEKLNTFQIQ